MEYLKYTRTFLNSLNFQSSSIVEVDTFLQNKVKCFLYNKQSFAINNEELAEIGEELQEVYKYLLGKSLPIYNESTKLLNKTHTRQNDTTQIYGDENITGKYYEPLVNNTQQELKTTGQNTTWDTDETITSETITETTENLAVIQAYEKIDIMVDNCFNEFINIYY